MELNKIRITPLCRIAKRYGTDKCPQIKHCYTPFYYEMFKDRQKEVKKVVEMGIGRYFDMENKDKIYDETLRRTYHKGASLKMWRDFFPNAIIYGADVRPETMFTDKRIETILCDETKKEDLVNLIRHTGSDIDLFVDDASHHVDHQLFMCQTVMPLLGKNVTYVIEDTNYPNRIPEILKNYDCEVPHVPKTWSGGWMVIVKHKK